MIKEIRPKAARVRISLEGNGISLKRYPFKEWIKILDNFFRLVRTSHYALTKDMEKKKGETKPTFNISAGFQRKGSVVQDFEIGVPDQDLLFEEYQRNPLWESVADSFNFIVTSSRLASEGKQVEIIESNKSPFYLLKADRTLDDKEPRVYKSIFDAEFQLNSAFYEISSQVGRGTGLDKVTIRSASGTITFDESLRQLLRPVEKLGEEISVYGNVLVFSKEFSRGRFEVFANQPANSEIPAGKYSFKIGVKQNAISYIDASKKKEALLRMRPIRAVYKTGHSRLSKLLVLSILEIKDDDQLALPS